MKLYEYLGINKDQLQVYIDDGRIDVAHHDEFPLAMFTYGRKTVHNNSWDEITTKCRGLIVNEETEEIVARPFEKFFNYGQEIGVFTYDPETGLPDRIEEKLDGFLATLYRYNGKQYIASKGSFNSIHAKWATGWLNQQRRFWPEGYTPVFEGLHPDLRIVVDYGPEPRLVLLAMIDIDTGIEMTEDRLQYWAKLNGIEARAVSDLSFDDVVKHTVQSDVRNAEGFVMVWNRAGKTPFRLKIKYPDYLRLHRMVTGVTPKQILHVLANKWEADTLAEYLNNSTPWFQKYFKKWAKLLENRYKEIAMQAGEAFSAARRELGVPPYGAAFPTRKDWALIFTRPENVAIKSVLFDMLDGKDPKEVIWKLVKPLTKNANALVSASLAR